MSKWVGMSNVSTWVVQPTFWVPRLLYPFKMGMKEHPRVVGMRLTYLFGTLLPSQVNVDNWKIQSRVKSSRKKLAC